MTMEYKDYLLRELVVGDHVIFILPGRYGLQLGRIEKLTPKNVRIMWTNPGGWKKGQTETTFRPPQDVVKVEGPELTWYTLMKD